MDKYKICDRVMLGVMVIAAISVIVFLVVSASALLKVAYYQPIYNAGLAGGIVFGGLLLIMAFILIKLVICEVTAELKR